MSRVPATEIELKFEVEGPFEPPELLRGVGVREVEELATKELRATYYDTSDYRLARNGITLRYRTGDGDGSGWQLKLPVPGKDGSERFEHHISGAGNRVPHAARDLITALVRSEKLAPVGRLRTMRRGWSLVGAEGRELAELLDDKVSVIDKRRVVDMFHEVELEARDIDRKGLNRIGRALELAGAVPSSGAPKIVRALGRGVLAATDGRAPSSLAPSEPAAVAVTSAIAGNVGRLIVNDPPARLGHAAGVHQMRVAARRLRSDLRTFTDLVETEWAGSLSDELRELARVLGEVRDVDVLQANLRASARGLETSLEPLFDELARRHERARLCLCEYLRGPRYGELLERLNAAAAVPALTGEAAVPCESALPPLVARAWKKLAASARGATTHTADEDLHRIRIQAKRVRYAAEAVAPALGTARGAEAARFAELAGDVQDVLGRHHDAVVASEVIAAIAAAAEPGAGWHLAAGRLIERQQRIAETARSDFEPAWKKLNRKKRRAWLT